MLRTKIVQITPFSEEPTVSEVQEKFLKSNLSRSPSKNCAAAVVRHVDESFWRQSQTLQAVDTGVFLSTTDCLYC